MGLDGGSWTPALGVLERLWLAVVPLPQTPQASPPVRYAYGMRTVPGNGVTAEQQQRLDLPSITS